MQLTQNIPVLHIYYLTFTLGGATDFDDLTLYLAASEGIDYLVKQHW